MSADYQPLAHALGSRIKSQEILKNHTYFQSQSEAEFFFDARSVEDLTLAITTCTTHKLQYILIGAGANTFFLSPKIEKLVIKNSTRSIGIYGIKTQYSGQSTNLPIVLVKVDSGTPLNTLARYCIDEGLEGLEFLLSVPGSVGAGILSNLTLRASLKEDLNRYLASVVILDTQTGRIINVDANLFDLQKYQSHVVILSAIFRLSKTNNPAALWEKANQILEYRQSNEPINQFSTGRVFYNFDHKDAMRLVTPRLTTNPDYLINKSGLRGKQVGNLRVSEINGNFFKSDRQIVPSDVVTLLNLIKTQIKNDFGVELQTELKLI